MMKQTLFFCGLLLLFAVLYFSCAASGPQQPKRTPEQEKAYRDSLAMEHTKKLNLLWSLGYEPYKQNDFERAKRYFKQVAELDTGGRFGRVLYQRLGNCYLQLGQSDSAEWAYRLGIHNRPEDPYSYKALRYIYRNSGRYEEAIGLSKKLTVLEPDSASHYKILGELYTLTNQKDLAIEVYQAAVQRDPTDKKTREILDNLLTGDLEKLLQNRKEMVQRFPDDMKKRTDLADTYLKLGQPDQAAQQLEIVVQNEPQNVYALELLGEAYSQLENYQQAANIYARIIKINPNDKKNLCQYALSLRMLGDYAKAMQHVERAFRIDPAYGLAFLTRGLTLEIAADRCVKQRKDGKITFDDKLVYEQAYFAYREAMKDPLFASDARKYMEAIRPVIPEQEDLFMNKNRSTPRSACYEWTLPYWKEIKR